MSPETLELIEQLRREDRQAAMATLVRTKGTTPRREGTKMFVTGEGRIFGSVTIGGCVDARVIEAASEGFSALRLLSLDLGDEEAWEIGLTCGGTVDVLVEPLDATTIELYERARRAVDEGQNVAIVTNLGDGSRSLVIPSEVEGPVWAEGAVSVPPIHAGPSTDARDDIRNEALRLLRSSAGSCTIDDVYFEILRPPATLVVFGASAVAIPLVSFAKALGFHTIIVDGRGRFATRERFPEADEIRVGIVSEIAEQLRLGRRTPVVLVAHDYKIDVPVLTRALATDVPYIGLLGSRRRGAAILDLLREAGVAEEQLARVRVPIGLDLGGESSAEIALSIISEVIAVTHGRSGAALSAKS